jgi:hypothetical protein
MTVTPMKIMRLTAPILLCAAMLPAFAQQDVPPAPSDMLKDLGIRTSPFSGLPPDSKVRSGSFYCFGRIAGTSTVAFTKILKAERAEGLESELASLATKKGYRIGFTCRILLHVPGSPDSDAIDMVISHMRTEEASGRKVVVFEWLPDR